MKIFFLLLEKNLEMSGNFFHVQLVHDSKLILDKWIKITHTGILILAQILSQCNVLTTMPRNGISSSFRQL